MLDDVMLILTGFFVVMMVLAMMWGMCALIGKIFIHRAARPPAPAPAPRAPVPAPGGIPTGIPPAHVAAIAGAVAHLTAGRGRILQVSAPVDPGAVWGMHGRLTQFSAHRLRPGWGPTSLPPTRGRTL
ncbi:OadG family transporter subunit [Pararhodospirillum oryzae]|uniref:Oxaloacetate decarboxylase gamma chain n=1 Tax=Pararhodospirillum oryzae TaxID=478448 RepID=A0A512H7P3_9PROT|nr:OadG family transporter subunit [Pararhodospirillum oryzae]GEO81410.1 hypothetical protein ROR02_15410 [Pararhodospirillum oryzae]